MLGRRNFVVRIEVTDRAVQDFGVSLAGHLKTDLQGEVVVERAGVRFLVVDAEFRQQVQNDAGFHLQLASQLIDSNLAHR
jgi:hypothetical protein